MLPTRHTLAKDTTILQTATPQAASSLRTHVARTQGYGRMHPVYRRVTTQYLHTQSVTTRRRSGKHEVPRELSAHRGIGIAAEQVESKVSGAAMGGGGDGAGRWGGGGEETVERGTVVRGMMPGIGRGG